MQRYIVVTVLTLVALALNACGPKAADFYTQGITQLNSYDCPNSISSFKTASDMEFEDEGKWYPIYLMSLGISRYYCNDLEIAISSFRAVDQYVELRSNISADKKALEFVKSSSQRLYQLTEREETLYHFYMGMINYKQGNFKDALIEFKKVDVIADGVYSKLPLVALARGLTYQKLGERDNALVAFRRVIEQNPFSPVGYKLAIQVETDESNRTVFITQLKDKCGLDYVKPALDEVPVVSLIECRGEMNKEKASFQMKFDDVSSSCLIFDPVRPDFDFGAFAANVAKEVASKVARDAMKDAAGSLIPGGSLIAGLFLGGDEADNRAWHSLPDYFVADVVYLKKDKTYSVKLENEVVGQKGSLWTGFKDQYKTVSRVVDFDVRRTDVFSTNMSSN